ENITPGNIAPPYESLPSNQYTNYAADRIPSHTLSHATSSQPTYIFNNFHHQHHNFSHAVKPVNPMLPHGSFIRYLRPPIKQELPCFWVDPETRQFLFNGRSEVADERTVGQHWVHRFYRVTEIMMLMMKIIKDVSWLTTCGVT